MGQHWYAFCFPYLSLFQASAQPEQLFTFVRVRLVYFQTLFHDLSSQAEYLQRREECRIKDGILVIKARVPCWPPRRFKCSLPPQLVGWCRKFKGLSLVSDSLPEAIALRSRARQTSGPELLPFIYPFSFEQTNTPFWVLGFFPRMLILSLIIISDNSLCLENVPPSFVLIWCTFVRQPLQPCCGYLLRLFTGSLPWPLVTMNHLYVPICNHKKNSPSASVCRLPEGIPPSFIFTSWVHSASTVVMSQLASANGWQK